MASLVPMVLENDGRGERSFDIYSRMLRDNIVFVDGEVNDNMASLLVAQLLFLEANNPEKEICMYINSPGGSVYAGLAIRNTMKYIKNEIMTVCTGHAMSMGAVLLAAGSKGKRICLQDSTVMIHQPSSGTRGTAADMEISVNETLRIRTLLNTRLAEDTGKSLSEIEVAMNRDNFMTPEQALSFGIVDKIIKDRHDL